MIWFMVLSEVISSTGLQMFSSAAAFTGVPEWTVPRVFVYPMSHGSSKIKQRERNFTQYCKALQKNENFIVKIIHTLKWGGIHVKLLIKRLVGGAKILLDPSSPWTTGTNPNNNPAIPELLWQLNGRLHLHLHPSVDYDCYLLNSSGDCYLLDLGRLWSFGHLLLSFGPLGWLC